MQASRAGVAVALAATLHDPRGALAGELRRHLPALRRRYAVVAVAPSPGTSPRIVAALARAGCHAGTPRVNARGPLYRRALRAALAGGADRVHYLDFDRALHWAATRPRELERLVRCLARHDVVLVGRTPAAHRSHHRPLVATESDVNRALARRLRVRRRIDFLVPSFALDPAACARLLGRSRAVGGAIYGELAALLLGLGPAVAYVECAGLDWETPDRDRAGVARLGLPAWRARWDTPREWRLRHRLAAEIETGFTRALARYPLTARLRRTSIPLRKSGAARSPTTTSG